MNRCKHLPLFLTVLLWWQPARSQVLPLEIRQDDTRYNLASTNGMPISSTVGVPPGSDGRAPTVAEQQANQLTTVPATTNQWQSLVTWGSVARPPVFRRGFLDTSLSYADNAERIRLPRGRVDNVIVLVMPRATVGAPFLSRQVSFLFGQPIPLPEVDEFDVPLTQANTNAVPERPPVTPQDYWFAEPYTTTDHADAGYYWSPHARAIFASRAGPIEIVWRRIESSTNAAPPSGVGTILDLGIPYVVRTNQYLVSGSPVQPPRLMYWTERSFADTGKPVTVPSARVGGVKVVYNSSFPAQVGEEVAIDGQIPISTNTLPELRTLWYDDSGGAAGAQIRAYNVEGRILMELLGDEQGNGTRQHLGTEIVDVIRQPASYDVTTELGERLTAYPGGTPADEDLFPEPVFQTGPSFTFQFLPPGNSTPAYYAIRETRNLNDLTVHWMEEGREGLLWPLRFVRYKQVWPDDATKFSHYVRPTVATEAEAQETAVPLPPENAPIIDYQDPLDKPRGKLTETFAYYSWLDAAHPVHRALIRLSAADQIRFERVFSWLDVNLKSHQFANTLATNLTTWNPTNQSFNWPTDYPTPRVTQVTVNVGDRIMAPDGEIGGGVDTNYLAGYILRASGTSFHPGAYTDPFVDGFEVANQGAIIPVNAIPGQNELEVWWFRPNQVDRAAGFGQSYFPAVIGQYTLQWPAGAGEIILASNDGSGPLTSLEAKGAIYYQNDPSRPGYNPNEEHALMQGGQAFALRDDLNMTNTINGDYSSHPYVLLDYTASDNRPAMRLFQVLREKPQEGITFRYRKEAGALLQPPMPLPLLAPPLAPKLSGQPTHSLNTEITDYLIEDSTRFGFEPFVSYAVATDQLHAYPRYVPLAVRDDQGFSTEFWYFPTNVSAYGMEGWFSTHPPVVLTPYPGLQDATNTNWRFAIHSDTSPADYGKPTSYLLDIETGQAWIVQTASWKQSEGYVELEYGAVFPQDAKTADVVVPYDASTQSGHFAGYRLATEALPDLVTDHALRKRYAAFTLQDRKGNTWIYRGPHDPGPGLEDAAPFLVMKYYYKTLPGFYFPSLPAQGQPPVGTITPYLRGVDDAGQFVGDPVFGNAQNPQEGNGQPLGIVYAATWPEDVPVLQMGETLMLPKRGLPAVRGQSSLEIAYQESQVQLGDLGVTATLHDPTREKEYYLGQAESGVLSGLPPSVVTSLYQGRSYFPNLPPHLAERFFYDPNRGEHGALVFRGEFIDAPVGDKYVLLNVVNENPGTGRGDLATLRDLCSDTGQVKDEWDAAIHGLSTTVETYAEDPARPGTYVPWGGGRTFGPTQLATIKNSDEAVDSYALSATGPGVGYVTLLAGNGAAFTPAGDPVSLYVIKVVDTLYSGQINIVESSNPLSEQLVLQQVIDLAGKIQDYNFEWRIAAPVDGLPPVVYQNTPLTLMSDGSWSHLRLPLPSDSAITAVGAAPERISQDVTTSVVPVSRISYAGVEADGDLFRFNIAAGQEHGLSTSNRVAIRRDDGATLKGTVSALTTPTEVYVSIDPGQNLTLAAHEIIELNERAVTGSPQSIVYRQFTVAPGTYTQYWLSLDLNPALGARVFIDGQAAVTANTGAEDTLTSTPPGGLNPLPRIYRLDNSLLAGGIGGEDGSRTHTVAVELFATALPDQAVTFNVRLEAFESVDVTDQQWLPLAEERYEEGVRAVLGGSADVQSLADNYLIMRYQPRLDNHASYVPDGNGGNAVWSQWTSPQLAEGWIKRVLAGINPFNQRVTDLFNHSISTEVSIIAQAGQRWEGDVALNLDSINDFGLIEIYETVLNRGRLLSIDGDINYGPANDALLLAAGYLNDLYMAIGNEAWADASNPTIGIGTKDNTYGDIATALFSFRGQLPTLLEEELALLRGRDDFLLPGVELRPVYNRLPWNYTRGIDAGEVIYALNYNILDQDNNGVVDADDARRLYPQGHGDAYGHYLTALKGYYALLLNENFDWVPRIEAVTILGQPVSVDYLDERKFAAAAGALARSGKQIFDLSWRRDYQSGQGNGWSHFAATKDNLTTRTLPSTRAWGLDHWASRTGQGSYINWVVGNAILPDQDPDPAHQGSIQQVDRTTVPELQELAALGDSLQTAMESAESGHTPLGLPAETIPFDLNPNAVVGSEGGTHFEQIFGRARGALNNALLAFDDAKDVTRLMRAEEDSLADFRSTFEQQERAYTNALIELYGTPYPEDIGPGKTYRTGYSGPDLLHYTYIDNVELTFNGLLDSSQDAEFTIDTQSFEPGWADDDLISTFDFIQVARDGEVDGTDPLEEYTANTNLHISYNLSSHGFFAKPATWTGRRASPGRIQQAISDIIKARNAAYSALYFTDGSKYDLDWAIASLQHAMASHDYVRGLEKDLLIAEEVNETAQLAWDIADKFFDATEEQIEDITAAIISGIPLSLIAGLSAGGDLTSPIRAGVATASVTTESITSWSQVIAFGVARSLQFATESADRFIQFYDIQPELYKQELRDATSDIRDAVYGMNNQFMTINARLQELDDAKRRLQALLAEGDRLQLERQIFRQRAAAIIQGYRTRDAAFRIFRNEKLERYKTLFDLAAQYAFMAARAYDYETGLLHTDQGKDFINRIVRARALGVIQDGQPQFAGSNTGDPGLSSALAEMAADWSVVKGRLGFNNPDAYGTTVSLRTELFRIVPGTNGVENWLDVLNQARMADILADPDVRRYCLQVDGGHGFAEPGLVIEFSTTIGDGVNLFGHALAAGDHNFSPSSFATKIFALGVALEGYQGMDDPNANFGAVSGTDSTSPDDPDLSYLDPNALSATPYIYLVPVGVDSLRSPPLGDQGQVRTWNVQDVAIPLPFNIGASDFSSFELYQSGDSLSEEPFAIRKHQSFRPVSSASVFDPDIYTGTGSLQRSQFASNRLIGRSVWNSRWKLVIPGKTLLANPDEGLERFLRTVTDIKLHFVTYSYSGN